VARALRLAITAATAARAARVPVTPERVERIGAGWIAEEALALAVYCALACPDPAEALLAAVNHSGDSDSAGAICGNLLGAAHGEQALPAEWREALEGRDLIGRLADDLVREFDRDPRPDAEPAPMPSWHGRYPGA
jgi:ADP-ribosylglycohydrolase